MTEVYLALDHVLLDVDYHDPSSHTHLSQHLIISLDEEVTFQIEGETFKSKGVLIGSDVKHTISSNGKKILVFLIDAASRLGRQMQHNYFRKKSYEKLEEEQSIYLQCLWQRYMAEALQITHEMAYQYFFREVHQFLVGANEQINKMDERIEQIIAYAGREEVIDEATIDQLAQKVYLSKSRLSHLFKEETGMALNSFLVNLRLWRTYGNMIKGFNITEAAMMAGFNSSAHFAATNKRVFGVSAKMLQQTTKIYMIDMK